MKTKKFKAISALIGTIVGAGILGIPYVVMKSGYAFGILNIIIVAVIMIISSLYLGEVILRTKTQHQLTGYAEKYLGRTGKIIMFIAFIIGIYSALLAYLIGEGQSISYLFFNSGSYSLYLGLAFWALLSGISYFGLKALGDGEEIGIGLIIILFLAIIGISIPVIKTSNLSYTNISQIFTPFGVTLFAFLGFAILPEVARILGKEKHSLKKTIWIANISVAVGYVIFAGAVLGSEGSLTPEIATLELGKPFIILGMFTMFTAYLGLSNALMDTFKLDFKMSKNKSWLATIFIPLIIFIILEIIKSAEFTTVLSIGGVISAGLTAIIIMLMVRKSKTHGDREPEYKIPYSKIIFWTLISIFLAGTILEILNAI